MFSHPKNNFFFIVFIYKYYEKEKEDVAMSSFFVTITSNGPKSPPKRLDYPPLTKAKHLFRYSLALGEGVYSSSFV
jgi:hypothetical protein